MMIPICRIIIAVLFLTAVVFPGSCINNATEIVLSEEGVNIVAAIMLTVLVIAGTYMLGNVISDPKYIVFAKDELYHLGFSLLMLVAFSGIVLFTCSTMSMFYESIFTHFDAESTCYNAGSQMNSVSMCYMNMIDRDSKRLAERYIDNYIGYLMDSTFSYSIQIPLFNAYTVSGGAYKRIISNQYDMILNTFIVPSLMSISMQKLALRFITDNTVRWILPVAFVLRVFPPTRQMGNIMIALALGLYILVPFMYVFTLTMYELVMYDCEEYAHVACDNTIDSYGCSDDPIATCTNPNSFWNVARLIPQAFFLPNLTIAVLITFLSGMNKAMKVLG
ncbi:hypothetical protein KKF81_01285 [Candidatus Micrarchaeota archaeon]|nr:hypothetical protein [Candidatus Micrarchaeota archaeon]MBU1165553.1 hypothetical protein [Candidatus Micrarchaeota archaeon]MBU1886504.1 hypothetical protein [Candidatus Micrarchaeota archaeon]